MECFSNENGYGVTRFKAFERRASLGYKQAINNIMLLKIVILLRNERIKPF